MRSDRTKKGLERMPHRALYCAAGVPQAAMGKAFIGVATSFTDLVPGHVGMRVLERVLENGVHAAGGYPFLFGVPAVCDGIAMGHRGMHYSLPLRELVADMVESVAEAHALDGLVEEWVDNFMQPGVLQGGFDWYIGYGAERLRVMRDGAPSLPPIPHPARVLWGGSDKVLKAEWSDRLGDTFSDVEVTVVPEAGHYLHYERPDLANREMLAFFRRVLGPGAGP